MDIRKINDADYIEYLPTLYRRHYATWKEKMLSNVENILSDLDSQPLSDVMLKYSLSNRDIALLVRLGYVTKDEANKYGLASIEQAVPV